MTGTTSFSLAGEPGDDGRARGESSRFSEGGCVVGTLRFDAAAEYGLGEAWVVAEAVMPATQTGSCMAFLTTSS